jgi:hypothetical protein
MLSFTCIVEHLDIADWGRPDPLPILTLQFPEREDMWEPAQAIIGHYLWRPPLQAIDVP